MFDIIYIEEWKTTLILPAKVASTSIKGAIFDYFKPEDFNTWFKERKVKYPKGRTIAFIRNPYDRIVSCYLNKIYGKKRFKSYPFNRNTSFDEFADWLYYNPEAINPHWSPFYPAITKNDIVFRLEDAPEMWHNLNELIPITVTKKLNKTDDRPVYRKFYKREKTFNRVSSYYERDLAEFGYSF